VTTTAGIACDSQAQMVEREHHLFGLQPSRRATSSMCRLKFRQGRPDTLRANRPNARMRIGEQAFEDRRPQSMAEV